MREHDGTTYGNAGLYRLLIFMLRILNVKVFYAFMGVCVIPVTLVFSPGARLTYNYFRKRKGCGWWKALCSTYGNHYVFGQTVIDKFAMYAGRKFTINYNGLDKYQALVDGKEPFIQLSAHIGCSEILGYSLHLSKPCNVLVYGGEKKSLMGYRKNSFGDMNVKMIPVGIGMSHSEEIVNALDKGEIVSAFADRFVNEHKMVVAKLHGCDVKLAKGPFSLATTRGISVIMASTMKERDGSYTAYFTPLYYDTTLSKQQQRQQLADAYTAEVERLLEKYPLQWFNYSNIFVNNES